MYILCALAGVVGASVTKIWQLPLQSCHGWDQNTGPTWTWSQFGMSWSCQEKCTLFALSVVFVQSNAQLMVFRMVKTPLDVSIFVFFSPSCLKSQSSHPGTSKRKRRRWQRRASAEDAVGVGDGAGRGPPPLRRRSLSSRESTSSQKGLTEVHVKGQ